MKFGEVAQLIGLAVEDDVTAALERQKTTGESMGAAMKKTGALTEEDIEIIKEAQKKIVEDNGLDTNDVLAEARKEVLQRSVSRVVEGLASIEPKGG